MELVNKVLQGYVDGELKDIAPSTRQDNVFLSTNQEKTIEDGLISVYTHTRSGTVNEFTGTGPNGKALLTADIKQGDTFTVNGVPVTVENGLSDSIGGKLNGRCVIFSINDGKLTFFVPNGISLLWTNPQGSQTFSGQNVLFDIYNYELFIVIFINTGYRKSVIVRLNQSSMLQYSGQYIYQRTVLLQADGANFGDGGYYQTYGAASPTIYNDGCIPLAIYGLQ